MERYRVSSRPPPHQVDAYRAWLTGHAAEVVLAGRFLGAEVVEQADAFASDFALADGTLPPYLEGRAPALRAEADRAFPDVQRSRETSRLVARVSPAFGWETLGLVDGAGAPVPCPPDGPFVLHYVAPWCPDCTGALPALAAEVRQSLGRAALVAVFAADAELDPLVRALAPDPLWREPSDRTEASRMRTFHAVLRQLAGDGRRWGVPARRDLHVEAGRFVARWS